MTRAKEAAIKLRFKRNKKEYEKRDVMGSEALWVGGCAWMGHAVGLFAEIAESKVPSMVHQ